MSNLISVKKYLKYIQCLIILLILSNLLRTPGVLKIQLFFFFVVSILLIANDLIRNITSNDTFLYYASLALSIILAASLKFFEKGFAANIYMFFYVIEILYLQGKSKQIFLTFHGTMYLIAVALSTEALNTRVRYELLGTSFLTYMATLCILYLSHAVRNEREETKKLNDELKLSNVKLQEYSLKVEELSVARERERVAQELHDSLGHFLMALTMHLDFAEKIFDTNPEKAKEVILKAKSISKDSTSSLRMAVNALKEERSIEDLRNAINELIDGFITLGNVKIDFDMDKNLEETNPDIKLCIYKTIRESITNGIRHGKATAFKLGLGIYEDCVQLIIEDNGVGCDTIIKSNGLKGIEDRVLALGGTVDFISRQNYGFTIKAKIPLCEEVKQYD